MSIEIPTISITSQSDTNENYNDENDYDCDIRDVHTDVEDFDSNDEDVKYTDVTKILQATSVQKTSPAITEVEDYYDSDLEQEKSSAILEVQISLNEYLDPSFTEENVQSSHKISSKSGSKIIEEKFLNHPFIELDDPGCITDCENIDTSDDEGGNYLQLIKNNDKVKKETQDRFDHMSNEIITEITPITNYEGGEEKENKTDEEGACCLSDSISEAENTTISEYDFEIEEDENQNHKCNYPIIDITFVSDHKNESKRKYSNQSSTRSSYLNTSENIENSLTDVERLESSDDSSDESDVSSSNPILQARASITSITDIEDIDISIGADVWFEMKEQPISDKDFPAAVREMMIVKEDDCGDPVAKIIPLTEDIHYLNIDTFITDKGLTDVEEISDIDYDYYELVDAPTVVIPTIENAVVQNCENIKMQHVKKTECSDREPVTETEEFFEAGTVRRKRTKTKTQSSKQKSKFLDVTQNAEQAVTDTEEIEVSDFEPCKNSVINKKQEEKIISGISTPEQVTDLENVTGEEDNYISDVEQKSEGIISKQENFHSSVSTIEALIHQGDRINRKPTPVARGRIFESEPNSSYATDIEDIQLPSDTDENLFNGSYSRAETISPIEIQEILNDSVSVVHEKCSNLFNVDKEKDFIKGMKDCNESTTDVEYLDEEIAAGGGEKTNSLTINLNKGEEAPTERKPDGKKE